MTRWRGRYAPRHRSGGYHPHAARRWAPAIMRIQRTNPPASKLASGFAADPPLRSAGMSEAMNPSRMKRVVALATIVLSSACVGPFSELSESQFPDAHIARAADPSGWIPDILPADATKIREVHKIDSIRTWGCYSTGNPDAVRTLLTSQKASIVPGPIGNRPSELFRDFSWWPDSMGTGRVEAWEFAEAPACSLCADSVVRVGIESTVGRVCFHRGFAANPSY